MGLSIIILLRPFQVEGISGGVIHLHFILYKTPCKQTVLTLIMFQGYKTFPILNSAELEILNAHAYNKIKKLLAL